MACVQDCTVTGLQTGSGCSYSGGIRRHFAAKYNEIDWAATLANPLQFDAATRRILGFTMIGGATWQEIKPERKGSLYTANYTTDQKSYVVQITNLFKGKGYLLRNGIDDALNCCNTVHYIIDNSCNERLFGVDYDGDAFALSVEGFRIIQHDDISGEIGGDDAQDTLIWGGEMERPAIYGNIGQTVFESTYL